MRNAVVWCTTLLSLVSVAVAQTYHLQDHQYFKTMVADIRRPHNHVGFYSADPVRFTNPKTDDDGSPHLFWDVAFGDSFPIIGFNYDASADQDRYKKRGMDFFIEPNVHMLLDFGAESNAVINADYRGGFGISGRGIGYPTSFGAIKDLVKGERGLQESWEWAGSDVSWRVHAFHECTHLGDEFVLDAVARDGLLDSIIVYDRPTSFPRAADGYAFQRYNVSYEAVDLYLAYEPWSPWSTRPALGKGATSNGSERSLRLYGGYRWLFDGSYDDFLRYSEDVASSLTPNPNSDQTSSQNEFQVGVEYFDELARGGSGWGPNVVVRGLNRIGRIPYLSFFLPQFNEAHYAVTAIEGYSRSLYGLTEHPENSEPVVFVDDERRLAMNAVVGLIWGDYFGADRGSRAFSVMLNAYFHRGPNPHGQFRDEVLEYRRLEFTVRGLSIPLAEIRLDFSTAI